MKNHRQFNVMNKLSSVALLCASLFMTTQSFAQNSETNLANQKPLVIIDADRSDPLEGFNRAMWDFNSNYLDKYIARPTAIFYRDYIPVPAQNSIYNFATNFEEPSTVVNNVLQGNVEDSGNAFARFLVNSTVGLFGLFDVAGEIGLKKKEDQFGEVLAVYGVDSGPYLMLPGLGPTTLRNEIGDQVDGLYFPLVDMTMWQSFGIGALKGIHVRARLLEQEGLLNASLDQYAFVKEAYFQSRVFDIYDGEVPQPPEEEMEFDDDDLDD
jgi:phospholipid-binding lipoprotein MlaA